MSEAQVMHRTQFMHVSIDAISVGENIRRVNDDAAQAELKNSISQKGILVPLIVRVAQDGFLLLAGHRRYAAAQELKIPEVPCVIVASDDLDSQEIQIIENLQRADLHPIDEASAYIRILDIVGEMPVADLALRVGKSESYVRQRMQLLQLIEPAKKMFRANEIGATAAFLLARQLPDQQKQILKAFDKEELIYQAVHRYVEHNFLLDLSKAAFETLDATLVPAAGSCVECPKRSGNDRMLFGDIKKADTCTDAKCFHSKEQALVKIRLKENPDAVKLTVSKEFSEKAQGIENWTGIGKEPCDFVKKGVVVQRSGHHAGEGRDFSIGEVVEFCGDSKCDVHYYRSPSSGTRTKKTPAEKRDAAKKRLSWKADQLIHSQTVQRFKSDLDKVKVDDWRRAAVEICKEYSFKYRAFFLAACFGIDGKGDTPSQKGADAQEKLIKHLKSASSNDCIIFLIAAPFTPSSDGDSDRRKEMRIVADRVGVGIESIEKSFVKPEKADRPKVAKAKKTKKKS